MEKSPIDLLMFCSQTHQLYTVNIRATSNAKSKPIFNFAISNKPVLHWLHKYVINIVRQTRGGLLLQP